MAVAPPDAHGGDAHAAGDAALGLAAGPLPVGQQSMADTVRVALAGCSFLISLSPHDTIQRPDADGKWKLVAAVDTGTGGRRGKPPFSIAGGFPVSAHPVTADGLGEGR